MGDFLSFSSPLSERLRVCDLVLPSSSLPRMWVLAWGRREGEGEVREEGGGKKSEGEGLSNSGAFPASKKKKRERRN